MMSRALTGSCLCGGVRYACSGPLEGMARCYCAECRKASGCEFATNAEAARGSFRLLAGADLLREFESSPGQLRVFCGRCGSPVYKRYVDDPERVRIRTGLLDDAFDEVPQLQVFTSEKRPFTFVDPSIPSFERGFVPPEPD